MTLCHDTMSYDYLSKLLVRKNVANKAIGIAIRSKIIFDIYFIIIIISMLVCFVIYYIINVTSY